MKAYPILTTPRGRSAFRYPDPEGAPDRDGRRYHAALDWFAPGGAPARSAVDGTVVEAHPSRGETGQVFGGTVKVRRAGGPEVVVVRHVDPGVRVGASVKAGQVVAHVTDWADGPDHAHIEIWRTLAGGYYVPNMIDPGTITWTTTPNAPDRLPPYGNTLRLVIPGHPLFAGWEECLGPMRNIARNGLTKPGCVITWRGNRWEGPQDVTNVVRNLVRSFNL